MRRSKSVLLVGGSLNQTTMMHAVGRQLADFDCRYTPYYCDGALERMRRVGLVEMTVLGGTFRRSTLRYLEEERLPVDTGGSSGTYDLVVTCSDLVVPRNVRHLPIVLIQEGMTDPETFMYDLVRRLRLPRWLASTSTTGLSLAYRKFCVASEGYRDFFAAKGIPPDLLEVTGIPNFDDCASYLNNDFPHRGYVLVATSDARETFKLDRRRHFLRHAADIAAGRRMIFKLHPNENFNRSANEIRKMFPEALVLQEGNAAYMVANCDVLVTQYSSVVFIGLALGKDCHSYFDIEELRRRLPIQNGGTSAAQIARVCRRLLEAGRPQ
jgi:hypothetical protein